jgi:glucose/arabinose dehydrogenase
MEVIATGVRNTQGFDWHPKTGELWFTDHGRDWLGDNGPEDELNRLSKPGQNFGYPVLPRQQDRGSGRRQGQEGRLQGRDAARDDDGDRTPR